MNDEPVDLSALRTPPPLRESEYAAVRARVLAVIRRRERRRWIVVPLQVAAALGALIVIASLLRPGAEPQPVTLPVTVSVPAAVAPPPQAAPAVAEVHETVSVEPVSPVNAPKQRPHSAALEPDSEPMRIHIQTADPEIRIIWIVGPQEEES